MTEGGAISPENRIIARHVAAVFGGEPRVADYANASETRTVGILSARDRPVAGVTSYSTVRLSDHPMALGDWEFPARVELAGGCDNETTTFPNLLASAAFQIMQTDEVFRPGMVIPNIVRDSGVSATLPHVYLTAPFLWNEALSLFDAGTKKVAWLLAMPISDSEYDYLLEHGDEALEELFEEKDVDFFDPGRRSAT